MFRWEIEDNFANVMELEDFTYNDGIVFAPEGDKYPKQKIHFGIVDTDQAVKVAMNRINVHFLVAQQSKKHLAQQALAAVLHEQKQLNGEIERLKEKLAEVTSNSDQFHRRLPDGLDNHNHRQWKIGG